MLGMNHVGMTRAHKTGDIFLTQIWVPYDETPDHLRPDDRVKTTDYRSFATLTLTLTLTLTNPNPNPNPKRLNIWVTTTRWVGPDDEKGSGQNDRRQS